ncbi:DHA2 family efflux MFS transporter permease subunit [Amycolatopsis mediterranei]|nr:DHA2 family efflux MFS transporter permease subunit [Amycolatopsis mediterranei]UZF73249.1 DHA2 family efflux MFS transporter permease subunit [Amycolatopsis mediterranei]
MKPPDSPEVHTGPLIGVLVGAAFVMFLNETVLSVAVPALTRDLHATAATVQWVISGYFVAMAVVLPVTGFLLERFSVRRLFIGSLTVFIAGALIGALAPGFAFLLTARIVQAAGTATMVPLLMTSVMRLVPPHRRGATMGATTIVVAVAPALGPALGGAVVDGLGWRWIFWIVLPLALAVLAVGLRVVRAPAPLHKAPLDISSLALSVIGFGGILYGLSVLGETRAAGPEVWAPAAAGACAVALFVARQRILQRTDQALLDLRPLTDRAFTVALVLAALMFLVLIVTGTVLLPLYLQSVLGRSSFAAGMALLPGGLVLGILGRPAGSLFDRFGARRVVVPGSIAIAVALALYASFGGGTPLATAIGAHVLFMIGVSLLMTPLITEALSALPEHLYGHGSAVLNTMQQVAAGLGTAASVTIATLASAGDTPDAKGLRVAFLCATAIGVVLVALAPFVRGHPTRETAKIAHPQEAP